MTEISDRYDPTRVEPQWYAEWEQRGYFRSDPSASGKPYCIVCPRVNLGAGRTRLLGARIGEALHGMQFGKVER